MKKINKILSTFLAFVFVLSVCTPVFADEQSQVLSMYEEVVNNKTITVNKDYLVAGKTPNVSLTTANGNLVQGVDYAIEPVDTSKVGINSATLKINGIGNYNGYVLYSLNVYPAEVTGVNFVSRDTKGFTISWDSQSNYGVSGYKVYTCDSNGNNLQSVVTTNDNYATVPRKSSAVQSFVVKAYYTNGQSTIVSQTAKVYNNCAVPAKVTLNSVANSGKKDIIARWNRVVGSGYELQYGTKSDFSNAKTITLTNSTILNQKFSVAKNSTKYYVRIRAFRNYNGGKIYGDWSSYLTNRYSYLYKSYSSNYVNNKNRTTNLKIASKAIDGTVLKPGETFSFNKVVGKRTAAKGYKEAHVFTGPSSMTEGIGGGVCQVASTIFNTVLLSNLKVVERHQHSQRVSYVPLGRDAAIYWGSEDFKFKNNTDKPIMIRMTVKNGKITCSFYTCEEVKPKKVSLKVSRKGNNFTLKRYVGKKCNYTTKSKY